MNILIVDDNKNSRMLIRFLLRDYMEENNAVKFSIYEAVDGLEAVQMCKGEHYDIILMDMIMSNMNGIEATKIIRQGDKKVMIIAMSAVNNTRTQQEILYSGAEDYISIPVNANVFNVRMTNYIKLAAFRNKKEFKNKGGVNLFTKDIYNRYSNFNLSCEDALSELWECFLLEGDGRYESLSDVIRMIFALGEIQIQLGIKSSLIVESSYEHQYFTVKNIDAVPSKVLTLLLQKNEVTCEYKIENGMLSFKLKKIEKAIEVDTPSTEEVEKKSETTTSSVSYASSELQVFDYIDPDDMIDLEEYIGKLNSLMLIVGSGDVSEEEAIEMYSYIEKLGSVLSSYSEIYVISNSLSTLANDIATHTDVFIQNSEALGPMCTAFSNDLTNWIEQSFHTGAPSVDFMNDTIKVNCQTIGSMLRMDEEQDNETEDFDDIFDF